ncbi:MAG: PilZ domain-containing protein, partial [Sandaracinaceae bacterium]|nr:PilZ domain-containing protein [Sandaracinaceae bacterium]
MSILVASTRRRSVRRAVRARCQAVRLDGFRLIGERILDLSTRGALLACDAPVRRGDHLLLSFRCPNGGPWIDADVEVERVVEGWRAG